MESILVVLLAVALVTVVGHALWVLTAGCLRALLGKRRPRHHLPVDAQACPRCGRLLRRGQERCAACGLTHDGPTAAVLADLEATGRQLRRFLAVGVLDRAAVDDLQGHIAAQRDRLLGAATALAARPPAEVLTAIAAGPRSPAPEARRDTAERLARRRPAADALPDPPAPVAILPAVAAPRPPRASITELLAAFMEERNILCGELAGGLLIVGCSIALVISLWRRLEQIPYFPFLVFAGITAALFAAGLYTWHHWKLHSTSRGLLLIATLLVPLNFLVMAGLHTGDSTAWVELVMDGGFLAVFAALIALAARVLAPRDVRLLPAGVVGCSATQLVLPWLLTSGRSAAWLVPLALVIAGCQQLAVGRSLFRRPAGAAGHAPDRRQVGRLFAVLGMLTFAAAVALGFLVYCSARLYWAGDLAPAVERVALAVALIGLPVLAAGAAVHRGLRDDAEATGLRTVGTAVALTGATIMLAAVALAWPQPVAVVVVCALDFAALTYVGFRHGATLAHAAALPCLALGYLAACQLTGATVAAGELGPDVLASASGSALVGLFCLLVAAGEVILRAGHRLDALHYHLAGAAAAVVSLVMITWPPRGIDDPARALALYGVYGVISLGLAHRWRRPAVSSLGLALLVAATLWGLYWQQGTSRQVPVWGSVLAAEGLGLALAAALLLRTRRGPAAGEQTRFREGALLDFAEPLARSSEGVALLAILAAVWGGMTVAPWAFAHVLTGSCLLGLYLLLAATEQHAGFARLAGVMLVGTAAEVTGCLDEALPQSLQLGGARFTGLIATSMAAVTVVVAAVTVWTGRSALAPAERPTDPPWYAVMTVAWRQTAPAAGILTLLLSLLGLGPAGWQWTGLTLGLLAATAFALAWGCQSVVWTWVGSVLALGGIADVLAWHSPGSDSSVARLGVALLAHASFALLAGLGLRNKTLASGSPIYRLYAQPLGQAVLVSSGLALPLILAAGWDELVSPSVCLLWLAGVWLALSWADSRPRLFGAGQAALCLAVLFGITAWLETQPWFFNHTVDLGKRLGDPRTLQAYCAGLALLSLLWMTARMLLRSNSWANRLLEPGWPAVDRLTLAVLVILQSVLAVAAAWPAISAEFSVVGGALNGAPWPPALLSYCFGPGAWLVLLLTAGVLGLGLWDRWGSAAVAGLVILALTVPVLAVGRLTEAHAAAWALRWGLALAFLGCSIPLWARSPLSRVAAALRWRIGPIAPEVSRRVLVAGGAVPVLILAAVAWAVAFAGGQAPQPAADAWFARVNWILGLAIPLAILAVALVGHALRERSLAYAFSAGLVLNAAVIGSLPLASLGNLAFIQVVCSALASALWSALAWWARKRALNLYQRWLPLHEFWAVAGLCLLAVLVFLAGWSSLAGSRVWAGGTLPWVALGAVASALAVCLMDPQGRCAPAGLYAIGLMTIGLALHQAALNPADVVWTAAPALALYALFAAAVRPMASRLRHALAPSAPPQRWFLPAQGAVALLALGPAVWVSMTFDSSPRRLAGPLASGILLLAGVMMARVKKAAHQRLVRFVSLAVSVAVAAELGWAMLDPARADSGWLWLHRAIFLMAGLALMTLVSGVVLGGGALRQTGWAECGRQAGPVFGILATAALVGVLAQEAWLYHVRQALIAPSDTLLALSPPPMAPFAIVLVLVALAALMLACLCFAVLPGRDPFGFSERGRMSYVYAAEVILVLAFVHLRLTVPVMFHPGLTGHHWPFIVMAIAFIGAGLSEWSNRRGLRVLAEPLERTGVCLPLLSVLAAWVLPAGQYATLWFLAGLLYAFLSITNHSLRYALLSAVAANAGLWVLLHHHRLLFLNHPQMWLIPLAVIVLVSEHVNRDHLSTYQAAVLRYLALIVIYVSSTTDMFLAGLGESWQWPLVLAALSVLGILLGMLLRVRAFLFLGSTFLVLVIVTIIWHAGIDERRTWILWASGVVLGAGILALFGAFEKHRNELLRLVEELREWD
ncbi:MAG TPA: hypothetical protein VG013_40535 [Gemmataceae bacterium]|nr:hypothetical protein [Gemmataceae bacterium]